MLVYSHISGPCLSHDFERPNNLGEQKGRRIQTPNGGRPTRRDSGTIIASIWRVGYTYAHT
jgi:hypothetical protein